MLELIILVVVVGYVWFWYTDRKNTMEVTGHTLGVIRTTIKGTAKAIKLEADIAKANNNLADLEGRVHAYTGRKSGIKSGRELLESVGIDQDYYTRRTQTLADINAKIAARK